MRKRSFLLAATLFGCSCAFADAPANHAAASGTPAATPASTTSASVIPAAAPSTARVAVLTGDEVIQILDETVDWYRTLGAQQQNANQPSDLLIVFANRQTADKVVALAFEIARANAELLSSEASAAPAAADAASPEALAQQQNQLDSQRQSIQQEMTADRLKATGRTAQEIAAKLPELQGELAMVNARRNLLDTMSEFVNESDPRGAGANALKAQIDAIAATVPQSSAAQSSVAPGGASTSSVSTSGTSATGGPAAGVASPAGDGLRASPTRFGIWELGVNVMQLRSKMATIDAIDQRTAALAATFQHISDPPLRQLKAFSNRSDALAKQADSANSAALLDLRAEFDTLAWLFKQTSDILLPLSKEQVLLQQYRHNLANWREATRKLYRESWGTLGIRLGILLGILLSVFVLAEVWRRAVLRYAHEPRRRYQLLLVRKIVMWSVIIAVIGLSFVTEISALATFAGLLTAGLAVAMQSVLVSVVGYFFLIGKYGIRVGDRIQIGTVVGEVIDLGLVRMHLMELNPTGPLGPTGRVVAFANLIVFQASGGLFKQIPGVNLAWRETTLTLPAVADYAALKARMQSAVSSVVGEYREEITRQTKEIERSTSTIAVHDSSAQVQMHLSAAGRMEASIRYPVQLQHAAEIEERVSEALLTVISAET